MKKLIDVDRVREKYNYDPDTGKLSLRTILVGSTKKVGDDVGYRHEQTVKHIKKPYLRTYFDGSHIYVHRLAWVIMTGKQPLEVDHINGDSLDNRWRNLREVTHAQNGWNQKRHSTNTSGKSGIVFRKDSGKWRARIKVNGKMISLGSFKEKQDAINARVEAEKRYWNEMD